MGNTFTVCNDQIFHPSMHELPHNSYYMFRSVAPCVENLCTPCGTQPTLLFTHWLKPCACWNSIASRRDREDLKAIPYALYNIGEQQRWWCRLRGRHSSSGKLQMYMRKMRPWQRCYVSNDQRWGSHHDQSSRGITGSCRRGDNIYWVVLCQ